MCIRAQLVAQLINYLDENLYENESFFTIDNLILINHFQQKIDDPTSNNEFYFPLVFDWTKLSLITVLNTKRYNISAGN